MFPTAATKHLFHQNPFGKLASTENALLEDQSHQSHRDNSQNTSRKDSKSDANEEVSSLVSNLYRPPWLPSGLTYNMCAT